MRRTISKVSQRIAGVFRWLIVTMISAAVFVPLAMLAGSEL